LGWELKAISIVPNMLENSIRAIVERFQFVMRLGFKMLVFHVKPYFITMSKNHRGRMSIIASFLVLLGCLWFFIDLGMLLSYILQK
jgi:hypothetical protein